jgi:hypothetical protein
MPRQRVVREYGALKMLSCWPIPLTSQLSHNDRKELLSRPKKWWVYRDRQYTFDSASDRLLYYAAGLTISVAEKFKVPLFMHTPNTIMYLNDEAYKELRACSPLSLEWYKYAECVSSIYSLFMNGFMHRNEKRQIVFLLRQLYIASWAMPLKRLQQQGSFMISHIWEHIKMLPELVEMDEANIEAELYMTAIDFWVAVARRSVKKRILEGLLTRFPTGRPGDPSNIDIFSPTMPAKVRDYILIHLEAALLESRYYPAQISISIKREPEQGELWREEETAARQDPYSAPPEHVNTLVMSGNNIDYLSETAKISLQLLQELPLEPNYASIIYLRLCSVMTDMPEDVWKKNGIPFAKMYCGHLLRLEIQATVQKYLSVSGVVKLFTDIQRKHAMFDCYNDQTREWPTVPLKGPSEWTLNRFHWLKTETSKQLLERQNARAKHNRRSTANDVQEGWL